MNGGWLAAACLCAAMASLPAQEQGSALLYREDFSRFSGVDWELDEGFRAAGEGGERYLVGEGHQWARYTRYLAADTRLTFRLKLLRGDIHLVCRLGQSGRYFISFSPGGSSLHKQYWPDTFLELPARSSARHRTGRWYSIEIECRGDTISFSVDGRRQWSYRDREALKGGTFAFETLEDSLAQIDDIAVYGKAVLASLKWVRTGGPLGGLGYDIRMRPDNPDILYVTDAYAGVFKSCDGGQNWAPINSGIVTRSGPSGDAIPVFCLTIDPHDHDILWIGTQNVRGIFKSTDGGESWMQMDRGVEERSGITFRGFTVDPRSSDIVYAAAELSSWCWAGEERKGREFDLTRGVVYKTTDGGLHWKAVWRGDNLARYVWIDPQDPQTLYISTGIFDREAANSHPAAGRPGGVGIIKSRDGGTSWRQVNSGLDNLYVGTLFLHPRDPRILLAGTGNNQYHDRGGVYLSLDGGASWRQTLGGENINSVEFALSDPRTAYAAGADGVYASADGGRSWRRMSSGDPGWGPPGIRAGFPIDLQVDPRDPKRIFANNYGGGNFLSNDGGASWIAASRGYTGAQARDIAVDPKDRNTVYAAARSGIFTSPDGGSTWKGLGFQPVNLLEWNAVAVDPGDRRHILAASNHEQILAESRDGGSSWRIAHRSRSPGTGWRVIAFAPSDPRIVYAGLSAYYSAGSFDNTMEAGGIQISTDGGSRWKDANDDASRTANVSSLLVDRKDPRLVHAGTLDRGVLKSTDAGGRWAAKNRGLPSPRVLSIAQKPGQPAVLLAGIERGGVYKSLDAGESWQASAEGMNPEASVTDLVFDPRNGDVLYAADLSGGVYRSEDGGESWEPVNNGLRTRAVNALALSADGGRLYAATEGEGVFRLDIH
jgi:photosystem II stability/assembly factor-like uncharacterized protein